MTVDVVDGGEPPAPGDALVPTPPRRAYYIVHTIRPVESKTNPNRWRLGVERVPPAKALEDLARTWPYT